MSDDALMAHRALVDATAVVRAYAGSDVSRHLVELLDALSAGYCLDLIEVGPEGLLRLQAAIKQVRALRTVISGGGLDTPRI